MKQGDSIAGFELIETLGSGGNAVVWRARTSDGDEIALKVLKTKRVDTEPYRRFRREIETLETIGPRSGILPVLASSLPGTPTAANPAWIAMPIARPLREALAGRSLEEVVDAITSIAETLAFLLAEHGVSHRDVKPSNLYLHAGVATIGDFGLVHVPDGEALTDEGASLGPVYFTAYELLADAAAADAGPADVYSLAKTLWVLATGQRWAPPGEQHAGNAAHSIGLYVRHPRIGLLDGLIERSTRMSPADRPSMAEFAADLRAWLAAPAGQHGEVDLSEVMHRLRAAARPALDEAARHESLKANVSRNADRIASALRPAEKSIERDYSLCETDAYDSFVESMLKHHEFMGSVGLIDQQVRATRLDSSRDFAAISLIIGRSVAVTEDGLLHLDGVAYLGSTRTLGGNEGLWRASVHPVPAGSVQADVAVDGLINEILAGLPQWLQAFTERLTARQRTI
jgi:serine/threonine protein kinase